MASKTLILSDTHMGRPGRPTAEALRPLWQGVDELIINGDVAEVQIPWLRTSAVREVQRLTKLTERDGVRLTLISGNHDAYLTDRRCVQIADGKALVMHGDALHPAVAPWTRSAPAMHQHTENALSQYPPQERDTLRARLAVAQHVGHTEFLEEYILSHRGEHALLRALTQPWEVAKVLWYWRREPKLAERFLQQYMPDARYLILGHSHRAGVWYRGERTIINTGGFMFPARPWCVAIDDQGLQVERLHKRKGAYHRPQQPSVRFDEPMLSGHPYAQPIAA